MLRHTAVRHPDEMFLRVWHYEVAEGREADFEQVYGADGDWARLFARSRGYLGTELFRSLGESRSYVTVDRFGDEDLWRRFLTDHAGAYAALDRRGEGLTVREREIATNVLP